MAGLGRGAAILISVIIGLIILPILGIKGLFCMVIIGFIANYLTVDSQRSYIIGTIAGGIIGLIVFMFGFFASPTLPYTPSISTSKMISLQLGGLFTLLLGFILLIGVCAGLGAVGGAIVQKLFKKKAETGRYSEGYQRRNTQEYKKRNIPQKSFINKLMALTKNKSQKRFNSKPRRDLNKNRRRKSFNDKPKRTLNKK